MVPHITALRHPTTNLYLSETYRYHDPNQDLSLQSTRAIDSTLILLVARLDPHISISAEFYPKHLLVGKRFVYTKQTLLTMIRTVEEALELDMPARKVLISHVGSQQCNSAGRYFKERNAAHTESLPFYYSLRLGDSTAREQQVSSNNQPVSATTTTTTALL